ncbi:gamma-mobile-trio recombinase GmtY [Pseudomonas sp. PH1b]|uniref:gamma-mobile-trio recombinase GmtY n=1 Tax=Pseudomonas sp. PH1b TaxID=1397282 RepID=UPI0005BA7C12|nr:gamma-mobile-trio recombinase GmtY [Pseudomonas sp. PH1b]
MAYIIKIKARYQNDQTGRFLKLPALFTESGLLISHLRYLADNSKKSSSWKEKSTQAVKLLIEYINANAGLFRQTTKLLASFARALEEGTVDPRTLKDPSHLFWLPRSSEHCSDLLFLITNYTDWLTRQSDFKIKPANPFRQASSTEQRMNWCAFHHKRNRIFLNHLVDPDKHAEALSTIREVKGPQRPPSNIAPAKRFPEDKIDLLIKRGFVIPDTKHPGTSTPDYKGQALTLLMHYGGLRKSEALHLYLSDIILDDKNNEAIVRVYHPSNGKSPDEQYPTRKQFLAIHYGLLPRTEYLKTERLHLGWKNPVLDNKDGYFSVQFFPPHKAADFLSVWINYLKKQRTDPDLAHDHPYAFTNSKGEPETLKNAQRLHKSAVERVGLLHRKIVGTSEHGHRHSYGYRLRENGFNQIEIQKCMHHKSPDSCLVYIQPTHEEIRQKMSTIDKISLH